MTQPLALPNYSALGSIVTENDDRWTAKHAVTRAGWKWIGDGAACDAFLSPSGDRVIKLVSGDPGQRATLDAALAHPDNPHLPKVYGFLDLGERHFAVETELLGRVGHSFEQWARDWTPGGRGRQQPVSWGLAHTLAEQPDCAMKDALLALEASAENYGSLLWDCHDGNVMIRPSTGELVLNDLLYGGGGYGDDNAICDRCDAHFDPDREGGNVDAELWCDACHEHAVFCEYQQEHVAADENDADALDVLVRHWERDRPWSVRKARIAAQNLDAAAEDGWVWDEASQQFVEANLHAVLTAIEGIAREARDQTIEPRLPFRLAA